MVGARPTPQQAEQHSKTKGQSSANSSLLRNSGRLEKVKLLKYSNTDQLGSQI